MSREADSNIPCEVTVSTERPEWEDYLSAKSEATVFHHPCWGEILHKAYGSTTWYLTATRTGHVVGILQLAARKSMLFGSSLCSIPYFDASGILADDRAAADALIDRADALREELDAEWIELRQCEPLDGPHPVRTDKVTMRLATPTDPDELWRQLKPKVRNQVRKAEKKELKVEHGGTELLDDFFGVYLRNMRDLGSPSHSCRFFREIVDSPGVDVRFFVVRLKGRVIAASLTISDSHAVYVPWAGRDWRFRQLCGNMLLYWSMLSDTCERGKPCFDFGRCTKDKGTYQFKKQWGGEELPLHWYYLMPRGREIPEVRHDNPKYRFAEACWRRLPLCVAGLLGPRIIRKLS